LALACWAPAIAPAAADRVVGRVTGARMALAPQSPTVFLGDGAELAERVAARARVPPIPGIVWVFHHSNPACPAPACAWPAMGQLWLQATLRVRTIEDRFVVLHELGHVFDYRQLSAADRARLAVLLRAPVWGDQQQPTIGSEKFADAYALCGLGLSLRRGWIVDEYVPRSMRQHRAVCRAITQSAN